MRPQSQHLAEIAHARRASIRQSYDATDDARGHFLRVLSPARPTRSETAGRYFKPRRRLATPRAARCVVNDYAQE
jgi:hypothetical protein